MLLTFTIGSFRVTVSHMCWTADINRSRGPTMLKNSLLIVSPLNVIIWHHQLRAKYVLLLHYKFNHIKRYLLARVARAISNFTASDALDVPAASWARCINTHNIIVIYYTTHDTTFSTNSTPAFCCFTSVYKTNNAYQSSQNHLIHTLAFFGLPLHSP